MQYAQNFSPKRLNLDKAFSQLREDESFFLLNNEVNINLHNGIGSNTGKNTPMAANYLACDMEVPAGENYNVFRYFSERTNELYCGTYNSNGINFLWRINGDGSCQIVYNGDCLPLSADQRFEVTNWRVYMKLDKICHNQSGKQLIWVDGSDNPIGQIDVEASIATNFFTTPFFDLCPNPCAPLQMCVPEPDGCLQGSFVPYAATDAALSNNLLDKGLKFMYRYVYYDQRASEYSSRSTLYFQDSKGCFDNSLGLPRCLKFRIPVGNPLVEKIDFCFSDDGGVTWYIAETIDKYKQYNSDQQMWYDRGLSETVSSTFSEEDCSFDYFFCNDKQRIPIAPEQVSREFNPMPRSPQGFVPINNNTNGLYGLGFYNYLAGNCPIDNNEADKFDVNIVCNDNGISCTQEYAKVTVRAIVYNTESQRNGLIFRLNGSYGVVVDDITDPAWFGATNNSVIDTIYEGYDQTFTDKTRDFIVYIEGTDYWGTMEQWHSSSGFNSIKKVGVVGGLSSLATVHKVDHDINNGNFYYQEYIFTVPKGTKGYLRMVSQNQTSGLGNANQSTSTNVLGIMADLRQYNSTGSFSIAYNVKEIYFDTCEGDVELFQAFAIADLFTKDITDQSSAYSGYITDLNNQPVEGARIYVASTYEVTTDFNGYYYFYRYVGTSNSLVLDVYVEQSNSGGWTKIESFSSQSSIGAMGDTNYQIQSIAYKNNFYAIVKIPVKDCLGNPVVGLRVAISGSKYAVSGTDGFATFHLRNYDTRTRTVVGVVMDKGDCFTTDCFNNCNPCLPATNSTQLPASFINTPIRTIPLTSLLNTLNSIINSYGLKSGGRYAFGFVVEWDCGKLSSVNETKYINVPRTQEKGKVSFCTFTYSGGGIVLPAGAKRLQIVRSVNLSPFDLQWVVDEITRTTDSKIILTIQSLNDYNAQYDFKTNTVYKYSVGDRVEFIKNGDSKIFDTATNGLLNYLTLSPFNNTVISGVTNDANYFNQLIIEDDGRLNNLIKGAVIEIQTPPIATNIPTYFEICASVDILPDGALSVENGTFTTFDTYLVRRQMNAYLNGIQNGVLPSQYFESTTPSDFWGFATVGTNTTFLNDTGKPHFVNKYENERRYGRNITVNSPTQFNYFGDLVKTFNGGQDDITALVIKDDKIGAGISEYDNFLFEMSDGLLSFDQSGVIQAKSASSFISNPQAKLRGQYGCQYPDIGSIYFGDGYFTYIDGRNASDIIHNYQLAKQAGSSLNSKGEVDTTCASYFRKRVTEKENFNKTSTNVLDNLRYIVGYNESTGVIYKTLKSLRQAGINNSSEKYLLPNDTLLYDPILNTYLGFAAFTPEAYGNININNGTGSAMVSFQNSLAYIHPVVADEWLTFFGITTDWMIGITLNKYPSKIKIPVALEMDSDKMFFVKKVTNSNPKFISEIPPVRVKQQQQYKWNAAFLNNINSRGGLFNGDNCRDFYCNVLMVRDNTDNLIYGSIDDNKRKQYSEIGDILIKCEIVEQSAFTNNL